MALAPGITLGPYEILSRLGAGGMGEVYRARDTRLGRTVAIKVLAAEATASPEARRWLQHEARAISSLNHSHICTLFDVGLQDGIDFLVMEYLEGETLADRLERGAIPIEELLKIATQIAGALESAHRRSLTHRDLKPANIMLTKTGAKLLDFGIARLVRSDPTSSDLPTLTVTVPLDGTIVCTVPYAAPEVLAGRPADARSDLWALGAVIYEMTTGKRAFDKGSTQSSIRSAAVYASGARWPPWRRGSTSAAARSCRSPATGR